MTVIRSYNIRTTCGTKEELPYDTTGVVDDSIIMQRRLRKRVGGGVGWGVVWGETLTAGEQKDKGAGGVWGETLTAGERKDKGRVVYGEKL